MISEEAERHLANGAEFFDQGDYKDAAGEFILAIQSSGKEPCLEAERLLAACYGGLIENVGSLERAVNQYEKVVKLDPQDAGAWLWLGLLTDSSATDLQQKGLNALNQQGRVNWNLVMQGRRGKQYQKLAKKAFAQAEKLYPQLLPETSDTFVFDLAVQAALSASEYFGDYGSSKYKQKGIQWLDVVIEKSALAMKYYPTSEVQPLIDFPELVNQAKREKALRESEFATVKRGETGATRIKYLVYGIVGLIFFLLVCFTISSFMIG